MCVPSSPCSRSIAPPSSARPDSPSSSTLGAAMRGYNFTERVRKVLALAREESFRLHHEYVGTEHILLGIIREGGGVATAALQGLDVDITKIPEAIDNLVKRGTGAAPGPDLPYTTRAK